MTMKRLSIYCILLLAVLASCSRDTIDLPGEKNGTHDDQFRERKQRLDRVA